MKTDIEKEILDVEYMQKKAEQLEFNFDNEEIGSEPINHINTSIQNTPLVKEVRKQRLLEETNELKARLNKLVKLITSCELSFKEKHLLYCELRVMVEHLEILNESLEYISYLEITSKLNELKNEGGQ